MGRHSGRGKDKADDCDDIDVFWLRRHGYFCGLKSGGIKWTNGWGRESSVSLTVNIMNAPKYIEFNYTGTDQSSGKKTDYCYQVNLTTSICHFGGERYWFLCPLKRSGMWCGRRVAKLYLVGKYFGCRECYDLTYDSRCERRTGTYGYLGRMFKAEAKAGRLHKRLRIRYWHGQPTKLHRKILKLEEQAGSSAKRYLLAEHLLSKTKK